MIEMIDIDPEPLKSLPRKQAPSRRRLSQFLSLALQAAGTRGEVSVLLTGDRRMRSLNRKFRHRDRATDVLSFPAAPEFAAAGFAGDLAISLETAARQAAGQRHTIEEEIEILILHGLLHLAGYDHESDSGQMARRERALRKRLSLSVGLIERGERGRPAAPPADPSPSKRPSKLKAQPKPKLKPQSKPKPSSASKKGPRAVSGSRPRTRAVL